MENLLLWTTYPSNPSPREEKGMNLPKQIVTVTGTGNAKRDAIISGVLNRHPQFRKAAARIARRENARRLNEVFWGR